MFAFALWERDNGRVVLARDRLGIKPLYYAETANGLRFASTLPALLAAGRVDTAIDREALHHYMSWHAVVPAPLTILKGIKKLPPATLMIIEPDGTRRQTRLLDRARGLIRDVLRGPRGPIRTGSRSRSGARQRGCCARDACGRSAPRAGPSPQGGRKGREGPRAGMSEAPVNRSSAPAAAWPARPASA